MSGRSVEKDLFINATPERVFRALTEKAELERWFVQKAEIDLRVGGAVMFEWAPGMFETGTIVAVEPPHRLSYIWEALEPSPTTITFELTAENEGTRLRLVHSGIGEGEDWDNYYTSVNSGWGDVHLKQLATWIETGRCEASGPSNGR